MEETTENQLAIADLTGLIKLVRQSGELPAPAEGEGDDAALVAVIAQSLDGDGWSWRVQVCRFGLSSTRDVWTQEFFQDGLPLLKTVQAYADHPTETEMRELPERSVRTLVGWLDNFTVTAQSVDADFHIKKSAGWLREDLIDAFAKGNPNLYGLSLLFLTRQSRVQWQDGKPATMHEQLIKPVSIDVVTKAAAGGQFKYALASSRARNDERGKPSMKKKYLSLLFKDKKRFQLVRQSLVEVGAEGVTGETTEEQLVEQAAASDELYEAVMLANQVVGATAQADPVKPAKATCPHCQKEADADATTCPSCNKPMATGQADRDRRDDDGEIAFTRLPAALRETLIGQALRDSQLPQGVQDQLRSGFGTTTTLETVNQTIEATRRVLAVVSQSGQVRNPRATVTAEALDKMAIGIAKTFKLTREQFNGIDTLNTRMIRQSGDKPFESDQALWNSVPGIRSIRELYVELTGDREISGMPPRTNRLTRRAQTPWYSSDFTYLLEDAQHKRLLASYREVDYGWERVATIKDLKDFKTQHIINWGYLGDLPSVNENGDYVTATRPTDTEETYTPGTKGYLVELTRRDILDDDVSGFVKLISMMGRAGHRTLAKFVWLTNLLNNPTMADSVTLYHASRGNLITDPLGVDGMKNALTALMNMTEPSSGEKMDLVMEGITLVVPNQEYWNAHALTDFNNEPGGNGDSVAKEMRRLGITPVNLPIAADPNDWALFANKADREIVEIGFIGGNVEPEFFSLQGELHEKAFNSDIISRHKIRHEYGGAPVDSRGTVKSVVP